MNAHQQKIYTWRIQYHLGKIEPTSKEAHKAAHSILMGWGNSHYVHCYGVIKRDTGNPKNTHLGRKVKEAQGGYNAGFVALEDDRYMEVNRVINFLTPPMKLVINSHYFDRKGIEVKDYIATGKAFTDNEHKYYRLLRAAKQEAILKGLL